jgi:hypothetical protein
MKGDLFLLASDGMPLAPAQIIDIAKKTMVPVSVEGQGTDVVVDRAGSEGDVYYLIGDPAFTRSNLYRQGPKNPGAGLSEITHSATMKFDLSYDALSGVAAYVASQAGNGAGHIMVWSPITRKETDIGIGAHPILLSGAFFVVFERDGKLMSVNVASKEAHELLSIRPEAPFAVDSANLVISLYEPTANAIQSFSIAGVTSASYQSSFPVVAAPSELVYVGGILITAQTNEADHTVLVKNGDVIRSAPALFDALASGAYKLSAYHD